MSLRSTRQVLYLLSLLPIPSALLYSPSVISNPNWKIKTLSLFYEESHEEF